MAVTDFIAAIELGSTRIAGVAGRRSSNGNIQILAYASEKSSDCIRKGTIFNIDKTAQLVSVVLGKLEDMLKASICKVYVGVGGQSVRSIRNSESKKLTEDTRISQALIDDMMKSNKELPLIDKEILSVEPQEYKIGNNQLTTEPVGIATDRIEGHFLNIIGRTSLRSNIRQCFRLASGGNDIAECVLAPDALAQVVLTPSEKRSGCVLVDMGADTTTVLIYRNNILRHLAVIPLGGNNITKDICSQQMVEEDAEQIKLSYGSAYTEASDNKEDSGRELSIDGRTTIRANKLEDIIEARVEEILQNVLNQIVLSDYSDKLLAGAVLTGGAANMLNMEDAFTRITKIEKVRTARDTAVELEGYANLIPMDGTHNTLIGILAAGKENCCKQEKSNKRPEIDLQDIMSQKQEEEKRLQELAAEEARKEAEARRKEKEKREKKKRDCEALIVAANSHKERREYKAALQKAKAALAVGIEDKTEEIETLIAEINRLKDENNPLKKFFRKLSDSADEIMKE